jgi:zinc transport system substrate-binding protein
MSRRRWITGWLFLGLLLAGIGAEGAGSADRILVAASIAPLADFVRQVGGSRVEVNTLVPPGASPHTYELKPSQVKQVSRARLLVLNGAGLEYWAEKLVRAAGNPALEIVDTSRGVPLLDAGARGANPHIWLDVRQAMSQVKHIGEALVRADPGHAREYRANAARYLAALEGLDREIEAEVNTWERRQFIAFHPAWVYFGRRYGLEQVAVIERSPGHEPSPKELAQIVETARRIGARAIFAEPQLSPKAAEAIARESGARVLFLDPLGSSLPDQTYFGMMRHNVAQMAAALR